MTIHYHLARNRLTAEESYTARIEPGGSAYLADLVEKIVSQGTTVRAPDILAVLENAVVAASDLLAYGIRVHLGDLVELFPKITGKFASPTAPFDRAVHRIDVGAVPGRRVRAALQRGASVARVAATQSRPLPLAYQDLASGTSNEQLSSRTIGTLRGNRLAFHPAAADEGIFFVAADGSQTQATLVSQNTARTLVFQTPAFPPGLALHLEVRARLRQTKDLRVGRLDAVLTTV